MTKISLTPIIDVVFILLIFFMLASNFNKVGELNMDISKESTKASDDDMKIIKLLVRQDQTVISDGKVYDDKDVVPMIQLAMKESKNHAVILTAKENVTYQRYMNLMGYLKKNRIDNISIGIVSSENKK